MGREEQRCCLMKAPRLTFVPDPGVQTLRSTSCTITHEGGAFEFRFEDMRETEPRGYLDEAGGFGEAEHYAVVELARFSLSPLALARLEGEIAKVKLEYLRMFGQPVPDPWRAYDRLRAANLIDDVAQSASPCSPSDECDAPEGAP